MTYFLPWWSMAKYWTIVINYIYFTVVIIDKILDCCNKRHTFLMWWSIENTILLQSMTYFWLWWSMAKYETSMIYYLTVVVNDKILDLGSVTKYLTLGINEILLYHNDLWHNIRMWQLHNVGLLHETGLYWSMTFYCINLTVVLNCLKKLHVIWLERSIPK